MKSDRPRSEETAMHHGLCCSVRQKSKSSDVARPGKERSNRLLMEWDEIVASFPW